MAEKTESLHALTLSIEDGCVTPDLVCPHEGKAFTEDSAPDCRRLIPSGSLGGLSEECLAVEAWGEIGVDCLEVDGFKPFEVTQYPIPVTYRWEGWGEDAEFWVRPAPAADAGESL